MTRQSKSLSRLAAATCVWVVTSAVALVAIVTAGTWLPWDRMPAFATVCAGVTGVAGVVGAIQVGWEFGNAFLHWEDDAWTL